jgi:hypothetical protein
MYLDTLMDDAADRLTMVQQEILGSIHDLGYHAGMWVYDDEGAGSWAIQESYDGATVYWHFRSDCDPESVDRVCSDVSQVVARHVSCNHAHDCCGCTFLTCIDAAVKYSRSNEKTYVIVERWGRNV